MPKLSIVTVTRSRPDLLVDAIASLESQSGQDFEWIVINDGGDAVTRDLIFDSYLNFPYTYLDLVHPSSGFALGYGRNRGLVIAEGDIITYLDDDNTFNPNFVEETIAFFEKHRHVNYSLPIQQRRRDIIKDGVVKKGRKFYSPSSNCTVTELITHQQLIDSNGFSHRQKDDLMWNPELKIYIDYEFFLKCVSCWGRERFAINPAILVNYIQTNQGIIGSSTYGEWAKDLEYIRARRNKYTCLERAEIDAISRLARRYRSQELQSQGIAAFKQI